MLSALHGPLCIRSRFVGQARAQDGLQLSVETELGPLELRLNGATRITRDDGTPALPPAAYRIEVNPNFHVDTGQMISGVFCYYPFAETRHLICTELTIFEGTAQDTFILRPEHWIRQLDALSEWWSRTALDETEGGYFSNLSADGRLATGDGATDKWIYVASRTLYGLCAGFALTGRAAHLEAARHGVRFIIDNGLYEKRGFSLFHQRVTRSGKPLPPTQGVINIFSQIYALTGLVAYYEITRCPEVADVVRRCCRTLAELFLDRRHQGLIDALDQESLAPIAGRTDSKSFNSIVDPLSAALLLIRDAGLRVQALDVDATIRELIDLTLRFFLDPTSRFIRETFSRSWEFEASSWGNPYNTEFGAGNVGGNNKVAWILLRSLDLIPQEKRDAAVRAMRYIHTSIDASGARDALRGGWYDLMWQDSPADAEGVHVWHTNKSWWQQEEGILAALSKHLFDRDPESLAKARDGMLFFHQSFIDRRYGGVVDSVDENGGAVSVEKGSWLKGGYHECELARFAAIYLSAIRGEPVSLFYRLESGVDAETVASVPASLPNGAWLVREREVLRDGTVRVEYSPESVERVTE